MLGVRESDLGKIKPSYSYIPPMHERESIASKLRYNELTGEFHRKRYTDSFYEKPEDNKDLFGYIYIHVDGVTHRAHNIAWMLITGQWPKFQVGHVDGNPANNRPNNLVQTDNKVKYRPKPIVEQSSKAVDKKQVGGKHYKNEHFFYQHWSMVIDTNMHYLLGCATKYISRWRDKNGLEDLEKSIHYIEKADESGIIVHHTPERNIYFEYFVDQFVLAEMKFEALTLDLVYRGMYGQATQLIRDTIKENSKTNYIKG